MKIKSFEFNLRELAGSMGDFGTLLPLAVGYIAVCGLNPAGLLVMMGLVNITTGLVYRHPMPVEPMKVLAVVAIAQRWSPSMVYASGFGMGIAWLVLSLTNTIGWVARVTPNSVVRGIQVALGVLLAMEAFKLMVGWWWLGVISIGIVLLLRQNRYAPAALVLMLLGVGLMLIKGQFQQVASPGLSLPPLTGFRPGEVWQALVLAGFAQLPLTATNAVISTSAVIKKYWPEQPTSERRIALNMGLMNTVLPFFGGMPMCHGAGGFVGQYYFGARTGGANILEGLLEISLGLFLASSIAGLFIAFPSAIIGAMMSLVGLEMMKFARDIRWNKDLAPMAATVVTAVLTNMAYGFLAGLAVYYLIRYAFHKAGRCQCHTSHQQSAVSVQPES